MSWHLLAAQHLCTSAPSPISRHLVLIKHFPSVQSDHKTHLFYHLWDFLFYVQSHKYFMGGTLWLLNQSKVLYLILINVKIAPNLISKRYRGEVTSNLTKVINFIVQVSVIICKNPVFAA